MTLKDFFIDVKKNYGKGEFKGNKIANELRNSPENLIPKSLFNRNTYAVKGSAGQSRWAGIPWILITNKNISTTAQVGIYIVYLFDSNQENVYLCLGTGWTFFEEEFKPVKMALKNINKFVRYIRSSTYSFDTSSGFSEDEINLDPKNILTNTRLADGYVAGTIYSKKYEINEHLSNEELLMDLAELKAIYKEIINEFRILNLKRYKNFVEEILGIDETEFEMIEAEKKSINHDPLKIAQNLKISNMPNINPPASSGKSGNLNVSSKDYVKEASNRSKLGRLGEEVAIEYEVERLKKLGYSEENIRIEDLPKSKRDNAGYDLKSIATDESGIEEHRYIEVKTSKGNINSPFFMSPNEINVREEKGDKYYIYRIYNISDDEPGIYVIPNDKTIELEKRPNSFIIYPNSKSYI